MGLALAHLSQAEWGNDAHGHMYQLMAALGLKTMQEPP